MHTSGADGANPSSSVPKRDLEVGIQSIETQKDASGSVKSCSLVPPEDTPTYAPSRPKRILQRVKTWTKGPQPPKLYVIVPLGGSVQLVPLKALDRWVPTVRKRMCLLLAFYALWLALFVWIIHSGFAKDSESTITMSCISRFWTTTEECGLNGDLCRPFEGKSFNFRCPAGCRSTKVLNPHAVGLEEVIYRSLVVGGPMNNRVKYTNIYRGDSFVCGAAIHAGIIADATGGCGTVSLIGKQSDFLSSERNGITSAGFNSSFPLSFTFDEKADTRNAKCIDSQWRAFGISAMFSTVFSLFTTSPALFFGTIFTSAFFQTALASDSPSLPTYDAVISSAIGRFLPAAFVALFSYLFIVRYTLRNFRAQFEKTILWLGACWVGALANHTLDKIPINRLTPHDLKQQPGAITALVFIIIIILVIAIIQAWAFRIEGRLPRYLAIYAILGVSLLLLVAIPRLNLRIHHYILALLLLPGTKLQTRPSLLYQGFLVGLFINGVARWGFDSIVQTKTTLQADQQLGSLLPNITSPTINGNNITFSIDLVPGYDGISAVVNDVERSRTFGEQNTVFSWLRDIDDRVEYFRFGYVQYGPLGGILILDYTKAGIWGYDGEWIHMKPGPSR